MTPEIRLPRKAKPRPRLEETNVSAAAADRCNEAAILCEQGLRSQGTPSSDPSQPEGPITMDLREANECLVIATVNAQAVVETAETAIAEIAYLAEHDFLTGLPNRVLFTDRLTQSIAFAKRHGKTVALMYLDLDSFKQINDSLGHTVGDQLLQSVAKRLQQCVRHSDTVTVSRHGGDEFVILLPEVEAIGDATIIAKKLIEAMGQPHLLEGHQIQVTVSIGISLFPDDGQEVEAMITNADTAMYHAKLKGRNNYQVFASDMERPAVARQSGEEGANRTLDTKPSVSPVPGALPPGQTAMFNLREKARVAVVHHTELREANESLILATLDAQRAAEKAEQATHLAELENRLLESQKLETLAVLAGGVAHDFNNLLTTIIGNVDLGRVALGRGGDVMHYFDPIEKAALKAADLTRQLLAYAGRGIFLVTELDLTILVKEVIQILSVSTPQKVVVHSDLADRLPYLKGDGTQILQILMNLITNAFESFADDAGGQVTIRTRAEGVEEADIQSEGWVLPLLSGRYATLEVIDSGAGMTPEVVARIFEPFFSTKFAGRGLGLAAVMGIIRSHRGGLRVQSEPGRGSSLKIYLPAMHEARSTPVLESLPAWRGKGLLLIVDEDPVMSKMARSMAEQLGFRVLEAEDDQGALETFRHRHGELALVLMDPTSPHVNGSKVFSEMQRIDSRVPLVSSSEYREQGANIKWVKGLAGDLKKPYRAAEFQGVVQRTVGHA